jgi:hypothetical protein
MIGPVIRLKPARQLGVIGVTIARNHAAVVEFHQQSGVIFAPVGINHQTGKIAA